MENVKVGDLVIARETRTTRNNVDFLIKGKLYKVTHVENEFVKVICSDGNERTLYKTRFEKTDMNRFYKGEIIVSKVGYGKLEKGKIYKVIDSSNTLVLIKTGEDQRDTYENRHFRRATDEEIKSIEDVNSEEVVMLNEEELREKSKNEIINTVKDWERRDYDSEIEDLEYKIRNDKRSIDTYKREIAVMYKREKQNMIRIQALEEERKNGLDCTSDVESLMNHNAVLGASINEKVIEVFTDYIDIFDEKGNKFRGNKYRLVFNYKNMSCLIFGEDDTLSRVSWWSDRNDKRWLDPHPHVNGKNGEACWGEAGSMLSSSMNDMEIYASFIIVLNFLQQVNTGDPAGEFIRNWECINEDNEEIDNPYGYEYECCVCNEELSEDSTACDNCGDRVCEDHEVYISSIDSYICQDCCDNNYTWCDTCGEYHKNEDFEECDICGEQVCKEHYKEHEGKYYHEECFNKNYEYCNGCSEYVNKQSTFQCTKCGEVRCTDCSERYIVDWCDVCEDCYEEVEEEANDEE